MLFFRFRKTTAISGLAAGQAAIVEGRVVAKTQLSMPHTREHGVFFAVTESSFRLADRGGRKLWLVDAFEQEQVGFWVEDGTGRVWVPSQPRALTVRGAPLLQGELSRSRRWSGQLIREGDRVRLHGVPQTPSGKEPKDCLALHAPSGGVMTVLVR